MTLRTEFRITKKDIQSFQQATQAQYSSLISTLPEYALRTQKVMRSNLQESASETTHLLQTNIERSISVNSEGLSSLETMVESSFSHVRDGLDNVEESMTASFNTTQQQLRIIHSDIKSSTNITHNQIQQQGRAAKQRLRQIHKNTNRSTNLQKQAIRLQGRTERKLDELYSKIASITISPQNSTSGWSKIESLNLAAVTLPLMLMRPALFSFLATLISEKELTISDADVKLFSQEFNTLLSECHMASAKSAYETSWSTGPSSDTHFFGTLSKIQENPQSATLTPKKAIQQHQRFYHETDAGYLEIAVEAGSAIESSSESAVYKAHFTFTPHISIAKIGLCLAIERGVGLSTNSNIARTLRTYKVLDPEQEDAYLKICLDDDVGELQKMLSRREISPWDRDRGSVSMIHVCAALIYE
jgi:hypothetical protein